MWIDAVKAVAIIAVIVDHLVGVVYSSRAIQVCSFFSVTVFVFCGGITSFYSNKRHEYEKLITVLYKKFQGIMIPYIFATIIYQVCMDSGLAIKQYIKYLIHFNASPPFYFIAFYVQLVLISPFIYRAVNKVNISLLIILSLIVSYLINLFSFGIIMLSLGILGEYLWRTFDASRNRPPYIIEENGEEQYAENSRKK